MQTLLSSFLLLHLLCINIYHSADHNYVQSRTSIHVQKDADLKYLKPTSIVPLWFTEGSLQSRSRLNNSMHSLYPFSRALLTPSPLSSFFIMVSISRSKIYLSQSHITFGVEASTDQSTTYSPRHSHLISGESFNLRTFSPIVSPILRLVLQ